MLVLRCLSAKSWIRFSRLTLALGFTYSPLAMAIGLDEMYQRAKEQSELLQSSRLDVSINESERQRTTSTQKPQITLEADGSYHVSKPDKDKWGEGPDTGLRTEFRQLLYDGGGSNASIKVAESNIETAKWDFKSNEESLYLQVAELFYELLSQRKDLDNLDRTVKLYRQRVKDLDDRERIGRSREAEVLSARTQIELTESSIAATQINIGAAEEELAWLSGLVPPLLLDDDLTVDSLKIRSIPSQKGMIPSVAAAESRIQAANAQIDFVRSGMMPKLDFIAAHNWRYLDASEQGSHDFAIGLGLSWTLFDAGAINAAVTTATLQKDKASLAKKRADREGNLNLSLTRRKFDDSVSQIKNYRSALDIVERTLKAQQQEFNSGLITNLEMITTLDQNLQIRRNLDLAIYRAKLLYVQSQVYAGKLTLTRESFQSNPEVKE